MAEVDASRRISERSCGVAFRHTMLQRACSQSNLHGVYRRPCCMFAVAIYCWGSLRSSVLFLRDLRVICACYFESVGCVLRIVLEGKIYDQGIRTKY